MESLDTRWVILEEGYPHTVLLSEQEAKQRIEKYKMMYPNLEYTLFYDVYYEYSEIIN